jgi:hypothetical protein
MGTGQTILTIGALVLMSYSVLNLNRTIVNTDSNISENKFRMEALSIMNSHAEEAKRFFFDESTQDTSSEKTIDDMTEPNALGFEAGEGGIIDDFDDYNNLALSDTGKSGIIYNLLFDVEYVRLQGDSIVVSSSKEPHKRMRIRIFDTFPDPMLTRQVNGQVVRDTLSIEFVKSYWFYN